MNEFVDLSPKNIRVWFLLAFQAGAVNAGGFLACGRFVTHTTGFATYFGVELAGHHEGAAIGMLSVPLFFLLGAMFTAYFVELRLVHGRKANYCAPVSFVCLCLTAALLLGEGGMFGIFKQEMTFREDYLLLVLLSMASGLQNALITNSQGIVVRTTHMTGMTTDLAVGLVRGFFSGSGRSAARVQQDRYATFARAGIIGAFITGSTVSAYLYLQFNYLGFAMPVVTSLLLLAYFFVRTRHKGDPMRAATLALFALCFIAPPAAHAAAPLPTLAAGHYAFSGDAAVNVKLHYAVVYAFTAGGEAELRERESHGEECWNSGRDTYLCKSFASLDGASAEIHGRVVAELSGEALDLGPARGEPALVSQGDNVAEYDVPQTAAFAGRTYDHYRLVNAQGTWSVRLGENAEAQFDLLDSAPRLAFDLAVTRSKTAYDVFSVLAAFRRM